MRDILKLGQSLERLFGCVYEELAANFTPDNPQRTLLKQVADDEFIHANVMSDLAVEVEELGAGVQFDFRRIHDEQLRMLDRATSMLCEFHSENPNLDKILKEMIDMEKGLSENLFKFLALLTSVPSRGKVQQLAEHSEKHAERLIGISFSA